MTKPTSRMELIQNFEQSRSDLIEVRKIGRPVCPVLAGYMMALAEKLRATEKTQDFIRELEEQQNHQPPGPFSGVTGF